MRGIGGGFRLADVVGLAVSEGVRDLLGAIACMLWVGGWMLAIEKQGIYWQVLLTAAAVLTGGLVLRRVVPHMIYRDWAFQVGGLSEQECERARGWGAFVVVWFTLFIGWVWK